MNDILDKLLFLFLVIFAFIIFMLWAYWYGFNPSRDDYNGRIIEIKYKDFNTIRKSCNSGKMCYETTGIKYIDNSGITYYLRFNFIDTIRAKRLCNKIHRNKQKEKNNSNYQIMVNETIEHLNKLKEENKNGL